MNDSEKKALSGGQYRAAAALLSLIDSQTARRHNIG
ncbi:hypothetical protein QFZ94_003187 [Paraburkholderia sp. JPY465]